MNLVLLTPDELDGRGEVVLRDRRARHLLEVLRVEPGRSVAVGLLDGPTGWGEVVDAGPAAVRLRCAFEGAAESPSHDTLLLAVPRPKVLLRCLELAAARGFERVVVFRSWHTDKSHLQSRALAPDNQRAALLAGLELGRRTRLPEVRVFDRFKPFVEDRCDEIVPRGARYLAHADAERETAELQLPGRGPLAIAIGPERGFTEYEIAALAAIGFEPVRAGPHPMRVETAVAVLHGQLDLLRRRSDS